MRTLAQVLVLGSTVLRATLAAYMTSEQMHAGASAYRRLEELFEYGYGLDFFRRSHLDYSGNDSPLISSSREALSFLHLGGARSGDEGFLRGLAATAKEANDFETERVAQNFMRDYFMRNYIRNPPDVSREHVEKSVEALFDGGWKEKYSRRDKMLSTALDNMFEFYSVGLVSQMFVFHIGSLAAANGDFRLKDDIYTREETTRPLC